MSTSEKPASTTPILTVSDGMALIRLNRPAEHNRIEPQDLESLIEIYDRIGTTGSSRRTSNP